MDQRARDQLGDPMSLNLFFKFFIFTEKTCLVITSDLEVIVCQLFPFNHFIKFIVIDYVIGNG